MRLNCDNLTHPITPFVLLFFSKLESIRFLVVKWHFLAYSLLMMTNVLQKTCRCFSSFRSYLTATAQDFEELKEQLSLFQPTHAVVDLRLGATSGLELLGTIAKHGACRVVVLTGYGSISTATEAIRRGAVNYLTKPVDITELEHILFEEPIHRKERNSNTLELPSLDDVKWKHIHKVLETCDWNITHAAKKLRLHRQALQRMLKSPPRKLK